MDKKQLAFLDYLQEHLGKNYMYLIQEILDNYRIIGRSPLVLRRKKVNSHPNLLGIDPNTARYFYFKAAIDAPRDTAEGLSKPITVKRYAYRSMLMHYHCAAQAYAHNLQMLATLYPSDLAKMCQRTNGIFKYISSTAGQEKGLAVKLTLLTFNFNEIERLQEPTNDPYAISKCDPPNLYKPFAKEAPPVLALRQELLANAEESDHNWNFIED